MNGARYFCSNKIDLLPLRFDQSYAVPFSKKTIKYYEKIVQLYYFVFLGCEHFFLDTSIQVTKYPNAANWFIEILMKKAVEGELQTTKRETIDKIKAENRQLSHYENPFNGSPFIHTSRFFSLLLKKAQKPKDLDISLNKNILQPFKKARQQWSKDFRTNPDYQIAMSDSESGKELYQMQGSGSGRYEIRPLNRDRVREAYLNGFIDEFMNSPEKIVTLFVPRLNSYVVIKKET